MTFTRFERARIIGARALQIAMGAPILLDDVPGLRTGRGDFDRGDLHTNTGSVLAGAGY